MPTAEFARLDPEENVPFRHGHTRTSWAYEIELGRTVSVWWKIEGGGVRGEKSIYKQEREGTLAAIEAKEGMMGTARKVSPRILSSGWGQMTIDGIGGGKDFKLWPGGGRPWDWSEYGTEHACGIQPGDVEDLLAHGCETVILTTGRMRSLRVAGPTLALLDKKGVKTIVVDTDEGIKLYNQYAEGGKAVGGLFHSTC